MGSFLACITAATQTAAKPMRHRCTVALFQCITCTTTPLGVEGDAMMRKLEAALAPIAEISRV